MATAGSIVVDLLARTGSFITSLEDAEKAARKRAKAIEEAFESMRVGIATSGAAAVGAVMLMANNMAQAGREIENMSQIAGASTDEFQRMAAGAQTVGIQQDKLADQLKDFREKAGEFIATGGGGMKDFFEQVAPKVGVTADQFARLSGPQALQLYVDSLQKAGLSQEQMSFYLESMASDTTALIPLLVDGGKRMDELGDAAERTGQLMTSEAIAAAREWSSEQDRLNGLLIGARNIIGGELLPVLTQGSREFFQFGQEASAVNVIADAMATVFETVAVLGVNVKYVLVQVGKEIGGLAAQAAALMRFDFDAAKAIGDMMKSDAAAARTEVDAATERILGARSFARDFQGPPLPPPAYGAAPSIAPAASSGRAAPSGRAPRASAETAAAEREQQRVMRESQQIYEQTRTASERLSAEFARLNELRSAGAISQETYNRAIFDAQESFDTLIAKGAEVVPQTKEVEDQFDSLRQAIEGWGKASAEAIVDFALTGKSSFSDMVDSMLADIARMLVYRNITAPLASAVGGMDWGSIGASMAGFFGFAQGGVMTGAGPLPLRAYSAGGIANSPQLALYGEGSRPEAYVPLPDGRSIPVTMTGEGGAKVNIVVNNNAGPDTRASATATTDATGNTQIMIMVEKIEGMMGRRIGQGGGLAPMLEGRYGLNPAAGARR